jgi:hypothetical protein
MANLRLKPKYFFYFCVQGLDCVKKLGDKNLMLVGALLTLLGYIIRLKLISLK